MRADGALLDWALEQAYAAKSGGGVGGWKGEERLLGSLGLLAAWVTGLRLDRTAGGAWRAESYLPTLLEGGSLVAPFRPVRASLGMRRIRSPSLSWSHKVEGEFPYFVTVSRSGFRRLHLSGACAVRQERCMETVGVHSITEGCADK